MFVSPFTSATCNTIVSVPNTHLCDMITYNLLTRGGMSISKRYLRSIVHLKELTLGEEGNTEGRSGAALIRSYTLLNALNNTFELVGRGDYGFNHYLMSK